MLKSGSSLLDDAIPLRTPEHAQKELDLWVLQVGKADDRQLDLSLLDVQEHQRAARLNRPQDRVSYLAAHILLRQLLSERLGVPPQEIAYIRQPCPVCGGPHGRPELDRPRRPLHFSLSRCGDVVLIGMAAARLGVDIEALPQQETIAEISALLHASERTEVVSAPPSERAPRFARLWTRKEAYLKGIGVGITAGLEAEYLGTEGRTSGPPGWIMLDVAVPAGYAAAAAVEPDPVPVRKPTR